MTGTELACVRLPVRRLQAAAREVTGIDPADLHFAGITPLSAATERHWLALTALANSTLLSPETPMAHPLLAEEMIRTLAVTALHTFPNTTMNRQHTPGPGRVQPPALRRAVDHIEQHAHLPLTLTDIATAAGTNGRALQYAFHRHYATTPLGYLRRIRLERARETLAAADPAQGLTVAEAARRWGFTQAGHFTTAYQQAYGTLPSHTLNGDAP
ncbi:AraC family transcriptional regulator [Streptomyces sp. SGAir0957]